MQLGFILPAEVRPPSINIASIDQQHTSVPTLERRNPWAASGAKKQRPQLLAKNNYIFKSSSPQGQRARMVEQRGVALRVLLLCPPACADNVRCEYN
jgi:hypothetical protein